MSIIGDAALSALLEGALDRLSNSIDFAKFGNVKYEVEKLKGILCKINAVLNDAEDKKSNDRAVKVWLDELTDVAYDAQDVIEGFAYEAIRRNLETASQGGAENRPWKRLRSSVEGCCKSFFFNYAIRKKIKEITERLDDIAKQQHDLGLKDGVKGKSFGFKGRPSTTSLDNESFVYGRDEEKEKIIDLLREEPCHNEILVVPIVGMGGVGKTTLAQLVYNDDRIKNHFNMKAWACVSDDFDVFRITMAILESATEKSFDFKNLEPLQNSLKNEVEGKKFLLVLDDIWNKNYTDWDDLKKPFSAGAKGSKIIVTTRDKNVASIMSGSKIHYLKHLSDDACWSLFKKHAFGNTDTGHQPKLESIGRKIVKKCEGLPLALKTLGGLLHGKVEEDEWENILNSELWDLPDDESDIIPALKLSYHHLPAHLKRCFAYCAIFPKDSEFEQEDLILLWMAEGFLQQARKGKEMEDLGREYFSELLSRSFFQQSGGPRKRFVMHDLINDLAQCVAGDICFKLEDDRQNGNPEKTRLSSDARSDLDEIRAIREFIKNGTPVKTRHSSFARTRYVELDVLRPFFKVKGLRTLLSLPIDVPRSSKKNRGHCLFFNNRIFGELLPNLSCLRALSLTGYYITKLPDSIGDLKLLRYLNLSGTFIGRLPHSTSNLYNLQSLLLNDCKNLWKLPSDMGNLINMRHLNLSGTPIESLPPDMVNLINMRHLGICHSNLQEMPLQMGKLTNLRTLSEFFVGKFSGSGIGELGELLHLRGRLSINNLHNVTGACDATKAKLKNKKHLVEVEMGWSSKFDDKRNESLERDVLNELQPHTNLQRLDVSYYGGASFPSWIGDPSFSNITDLSLYNCPNCTSLPPLGVLPSLKNLRIGGMIGVKNVGVEFYGASSVKPFPSLESLDICSMQEWEEWFFPSSTDEDFEVFPCLRQLSIVDCPKLLRNFPGRLPSLEKLEISFCPQLTVALSKLPSSCEIDLLEYKEVVFTSSVNFRICLKLNDFDADALISLLNGGRLEHVADLKFTNSSLDHPFPELEWSLFGIDPSLSIELDLSTRYFKYSQLEGIVHINSTSLVALHIHRCQNLESLSDVMISSNMLLRTLRVSYCGKLKSLPEGLHNLTKLKRMDIDYCYNLVSFPDGGLPTSLESLSIVGCKNLNHMPLSEWGLHQLTSLRELTLDGKCLNFMPFLKQPRPASLTSSSSLETLPASPEWLPPTSPASSSTGDLLNLETLSASPELLPPTSPASSSAGDLPNLETLSASPELLPPTSPTSSSTGDRPNLETLSTFPEWFLPISLTSFSMRGLLNLETLSHGLQNLYSLQKLQIEGCPKIKFLPGEELLAGLSVVTIWDCPMLEERYEKEEGEEWPKIAHIPCIDIE